jgi:hypothetical protein
VYSKAETPTYACVLSDTAYFYADASDRRGLFTLPKTYFVKILSVDTEYTKIEYGTNANGMQALIGYVKTHDLTFVDYIPTTPYLLRSFDVTYKIDGNTGAPFLTEITLTCTYYGDYKIGSDTYAYVLQEGRFGYLPRPTDFYYPENTEYFDRLEADSPNSEPTNRPAPTGNTALQTTILILLCLLVPILAALILKSPRRAPYDDEQ